MIISFIIGTRPELIKVNSLIKEFKNDNNFKVQLISTKQQKDLLKSTHEVCNEKIDFYLDVLKENNLSNNLACILIELNKLFKSINTDLILVQGDTLSTFAGCIFGFLNKIKVIHLEAGLRTFDFQNPWPEESFRQSIVKFTELHLATTKNSKKNLINEGIKENKIKVVGNPGIDQMLKILKVSKKLNVKNISSLKNKVLITMHRKESLFGNIEKFCETFLKLTKNNENYNFIWILHSNPNVRKPVLKFLQKNKNKNIFFLDPLRFDYFLNLMVKSKVVITDSGGIQEECAYLGIPTLISRFKTERNEVVKLNLAKLVGSNGNGLIESFDQFKNISLNKVNIKKWKQIQGNGNSSKIAYKIIKSYFTDI